MLVKAMNFVQTVVNKISKQEVDCQVSLSALSLFLIPSEKFLLPEWKH